MFEQYVTIACVSNEVGGNLVGNAKWTGVRLRDVLDMAGVQAGGDAARRAVRRRLDRRHADGLGHGPGPRADDRGEDERRAAAAGARLSRPGSSCPGLYGYVSATKWLAELELTTLEAFDGYWVPLGWAKEAPILTQSRIDTPPYGIGSRPAASPIAGIAWAPDRGISKVEVAIDGTWHEARLSQPISDATWVQWVADWDATPGDHTITVRATDGDRRRPGGAAARPPAPDGARGWDTIQVDVG